MTELRTIIKTIVSKELAQDENVVANSFILDPFMLNEALSGDGKPEELSTTYQLDIFFKNKGELVAKAKELDIALGQFPNEGFTFKYESVARLWRGTVIIEKI